MSLTKRCGDCGRPLEEDRDPGELCTCGALPCLVCGTDNRDHPGDDYGDQGCENCYDGAPLESWEVTEGVGWRERQELDAKREP